MNNDPPDAYEHDAGDGAAPHRRLADLRRHSLLQQIGANDEEPCRSGHPTTWKAGAGSSGS